MRQIQEPRATRTMEQLENSKDFCLSPDKELAITCEGAHMDVWRYKSGTGKKAVYEWIKEYE